MKTVKIALDRERELLFDFNAIAVVEEALGQSLLDGATWKKPSVRSTRAMLWAALLHDDDSVRFDDFGRMTQAPKLTLAQCGRWLQKYGAGYAFEKLFEAWLASNAELQGEDEANPRKPANG